MKTLVLTSPFTKGPDVIRAQTALKRGNIFRADYLCGPQDGIFGESTGRACIRAKFWLGYSTPELKPIYGDQLHAYLIGAKPLGPIMKIRRARRLKAAQEIPLRVKALNLARTKLGVKEFPADSNRVEFSDWYGMVGPWCAMFTTWAYVQAGSKALVKGSKYAYVPFIVNDARAGRNNLQVVSFADVKPGDLVCFNWDGDWDADHVGLFEQKGDGWVFSSIEGNTSLSSNSNGGEVMRRQRSVGQVQAFVHVGA
jgi:peptidoglycan hydrolase-like protein with peptidoglycan-binding domain